MEIKESKHEYIGKWLQSDTALYFCTDHTGERFNPTISHGLNTDYSWSKSLNRAAKGWTILSQSEAFKVIDKLSQKVKDDIDWTTEGFRDYPVEKRTSEFVLPEYWHVVVTEDNLDVLSKWRFKEPLYKLTTSNIVGVTAVFPKSKNHNPNTEEGKRNFGIEITFEQFKKYVLKEDMEETKEFKPNTWYKLKAGKVFVYTDSNHYGIGILGDWCTSGIVVNSIELWQEATVSEIKDMLIEEAKKRGLWYQGYTFRSVSTGMIRKPTQSNCGECYLMPSNRLWSEQGCVFKNGEWAEIIKDGKPVVKEHTVKSTSPTEKSLILPFCEVKPEPVEEFKLVKVNKLKIK